MLRDVAGDRGSHAHRLKKLIEHLGLNTLVITDIDAKDKDGK